MHDIKLIREKPEEFDKAMIRRKCKITAEQILKLDEQIRAAQTEIQSLQNKRNEIARQIPAFKKDNKDTSELFKSAQDLKNQLPIMEDEFNILTNKLDEILINIPNILSNNVVDGEDESHNEEMHKWGEIPNFNFPPLEHFTLGQKLNMMNFEQAAKISGSRFVFLTGPLARLERALVNFMIDNHINNFGYTEVVPPHLVRSNAVYGVGQLPKFEEDLFKTSNDYYLISTSEVPLTNLIADKIIAEEHLPLRYTAYTPCYRSEAGSAGKDTKGMIRLHQFSKVELVSITRPQDSKAEHERMLSIAESILKLLKLPYRVMRLCSGDTGFSSTLTYDIEVWLPGQNCYREISSISNCGSFQARRLKGRYKELHGTKNNFLHTLNGSALPIGRTIVAIMENYQNDDGSIDVPDTLINYMGGLTRIV